MFIRSGRRCGGIWDVLLKHKHARSLRETFVGLGNTCLTCNIHDNIENTFPIDLQCVLVCRVVDFFLRIGEGRNLLGLLIAARLTLDRHGACRYPALTCVLPDITNRCWSVAPAAAEMPFNSITSYNYILVLHLLRRRCNANEIPLRVVDFAISVDCLAICPVVCP